MLLIQRIEMAAGTVKAGSLALPTDMDMDRMKPFRKPVGVYNNQEPFLGLTERSSSNSVP